MKHAEWKLETVWVARDEQGNIIRASDYSPGELLQQAEELRQKAKGEYVR
ncbi:hypothetical protein [Paenibacillus sp. DMB20]|nr:hypothetical protein [Paenibacillus sp. DMB20]